MDSLATPIEQPTDLPQRHISLFIGWLCCLIASSSLPRCCPSRSTGKIGLEEGSCGAFDICEMNAGLFCAGGLGGNFKAHPQRVERLFVHRAGK
jgi:hypothetical protein